MKNSTFKSEQVSDPETEQIENVFVHWPGIGVVPVDPGRLRRFKVGRGLLHAGIRSEYDHLIAAITCHLGMGSPCRFKQGCHDPAEIEVNIFAFDNTEQGIELIEKLSRKRVT